MAKLYLKYKEAEMPILFHVLLCIAAYVLWIMLMFVILPLFLVFQIFNLFSLVFHKVFDSGTLMCLDDIPFMLDTDESPYVIVGYLKICGHMTADEFTRLFQKRILDRFSDSPALAKLKQYATSSFSRFVWKSIDEFDLEYHIQEYPEVIEGTEQELNGIFLQMTKQQLDSSRPLWKVVVVNTAKMADSFIYLSIHHSVGDGFSLQAIFNYLFDEKPKVVPPRPNQGVMASLFQRVLNGVLTGPLCVTTLLFSRYLDNPFYVENPADKADRCFAWSKCPLSLTREIRSNFSGYTINDIFLACLSSTLNRYFKEKETTIVEMPIVITFNSRSFPDLASQKQTLKNNSAGTFISLPLGKGALQTLETIRRRTRIMKSSSDGHTFGFIFSKLIGLLPNIIGKYAATSLREHCSILVSNLAGSTECVMLNNHKVECFISTPPLVYDLGVAISLFTYCEETYISILSVKSVLPDPGRLTSLFTEEMRSMHKIL